MLFPPSSPLFFVFVFVWIPSVLWAGFRWPRRVLGFPICEVLRTTSILLYALITMLLMPVYVWRAVLELIAERIAAWLLLAGWPIGWFALRRLHVPTF